MALDADDDNLGGRGGFKMPRNRRHPHAEERLVGVLDGVRELKLGTGGAQPGGILGGGIDGDLEDGRGAKQLLGCEYSGSVSECMARKVEAGIHFLIFPDCWAEFLLDVADAIEILDWIKFYMQ